jgi:hypothetical protein
MGKDKTPYVPKSLDETYVPSDEPKLNPYDRLQAIFSEKDAGKLTPNAAEKLDWLLGEEKQTSKFEKIVEKIKKFFSKMDSAIFAPKSKIGTTFQRRKKDKNKWT